MTRSATLRQYGMWKSPITTSHLASSLGFGGLAWDAGGSLVWLENRAERGVLVVLPPDGQAPRDLNGDLSAHASVGYGGGEFTAGYGHVYFINDDTGNIFRQPVSTGQAHAITPSFGKAASPVLSHDGRWLLYIHSDQGEDSIAIVDAHGKYWPQKLVSGDDFYMQPLWQPTVPGEPTRIAWVSWNHPNMPWDGTFLRCGTLREREDGLPVLTEVDTLAGGENISIFQPEFSPDGRYLAYVSDLTGWWQLELYDLASRSARQLTTAQAEHGLPAWIQGMRTYQFSPDGRSIIFVRNEKGMNSLWRYDLNTNVEQRLNPGGEYSSFEQITVRSRAGDELEIALIASGDRIPSRIIVFSLEQGTSRVVRRSSAEDLPPETFSQARVIQWSGEDGATVYGIYYTPHNEMYEGIGKPPLIVMVHGGPTSQRLSKYDGSVQYFTSRGYAVLLVNYRGSTGYGRAYHQALRGNWGVYDVEDSISGARYLAEQGEIDTGKVVIMGGSAGGYTVLQALVNNPGFFKAGVCLFGISNMLTFTSETHKFEAHYTDSLLGPLPEAADIYRQRSPLFFSDRIQDPLAIFHGEIDRVVPRQQSDEVVDVLRRRGIPHIYHVYPGEGHGFRKISTIEHYYKSVEEFLRQFVLLA